MSSIKELWAQQAIKILQKEIKQIENVDSWAKLVGHSRVWLGKYIKEVYKDTPKSVLRSIRFKKIIQTIKDHPNSTSCYVAVESGLRDEKSLYKFLRSHFDTTFTQLRAKIITGDDLQLS